MLFPSGGLPYVGLCLVALTWISRWIATGHLTVSTGLEFPIGLIMVMAIIGYAISIRPDLSYTRIWSLILGVSIFYGLANFFAIEKQATAFFSILAVLMMGILGISLLGTDWNLTRLVEIPWIYDRLPALIRNLPGSGVPRASDLINPNLVGITMGMFTAIFLTSLFFSANKRLRWLSLIMVIIGSATILLTQSLAGLMGLLAAILFLAIYHKRWILAASLVAVACGLAVLILVRPIPIIQYMLSTNNPVGIAVALRLDMWSRALTMIHDMPYSGIGLNTFSVIQSSFYPGYLLGPEPHAHNLFLQTALDLGLPGLLAFLWLLAAWIFGVRQKYSESNVHEYKVLLLGLVAGVIAYFFSGMIDALMLGSKPGIAFWIFLSIGAAPGRQADLVADSVKIRRRDLWRVLQPVAIIIAITLASMVLRPGSILMNIGAIQAHQELYHYIQTGRVDQSAIESAKVNLIKAVSLNHRYLNAYELLGGLYTIEGSPGKAIATYAKRVANDEWNPMLRYSPSMSILRTINGENTNETENWLDLIRIYGQWNTRFPNRAEIYTEIAIVWQCYLDQSKNSIKIIDTAIEKQAQPKSLLEYYRYLISAGEGKFCVEKQ